jgi:DNA-binding Lrp family transcriptional regulator
MNLETLDTSSLNILEFLASNPWQRAKAIEKPISLTSGPVQMRLKGLVEKGYLVRRGAVGTEHKFHPTYEYALNERVNVEEISRILKDRQSPTLLSINTEEVNPRQSTQVESSSQSYDHDDLIAELLEAAIDRIAELESRVSQLENRKSTRVKLNRVELLQKLKAKDSSP